MKRGPKPKPIHDLFYSHIIELENGCWIWTARIFPNGYGQFIRKELREVYAHRVSWIIHNGPIPCGEHVLHNCPDGDNRSCVNPNHLWLGSDKDNKRDMVEKGRSLRGERHNLVKLTEQQVKDIRSRYRSIPRVWSNGKELAEEYGISLSHLNRIIARGNWKHLSTPTENNHDRP